MAASDILRNPVKDKLARGEVVVSMTVRLARSIEIARIAKTAGFDMLYIDLEHSPLTHRCHRADLHVLPRPRRDAGRAGAGQHA